MPQESLETQIDAIDHSAVSSLMDEVFGKEETAALEAPKAQGEPKPDSTTSGELPDQPLPQTEQNLQKTPPAGNQGAKTNEPAPTPEAKTPPAAAVPTPGQNPPPSAAAAVPEVKTTANPVDAIIEPRGLNPKSKEGWTQLRTLAKDSLAAKEALEKEVVQLRQQVKTTGTAPSEEATKRINTLEAELGQYKLLYTTETSPEFISKYEGEVKKVEESVYGVLKSNGMTDEVLGRIKANGGLGKLPAVFWDQHVLPNVSGLDKRRIEDGLLKIADLQKQRQEELSAIPAKREEFEAQRKDQLVKAYQADQTAMNTHLEALTKDIPWARLQEVPANATPEQKAKIDAENKFFKESQARFQAALYPRDAVTRVETAAAACLSFKLAADLDAASAHITKVEAENAQLKQQLEAIKSAGITAKSGAAAPRTGTKPAPTDRLTMKNEDAIDAGLDAVGAV